MLQESQVATVELLTILQTALSKWCVLMFTTLIFLLVHLLVILHCVHKKL